MTAAMEDYLEMMLRLEREGQALRVKRLAEMLNVRPSSASKMLLQLRERGFAAFEKYGYIHLTETGRQEGEYLLFRHAVINRLLCFINGSADELEQTEKIEHFVSRETVMNMNRLLERLAQMK